MRKKDNYLKSKTTEDSIITYNYENMAYQGLEVDIIAGLNFRLTLNICSKYFLLP